MWYLTSKYGTNCMELANDHEFAKFSCTNQISLNCNGDIEAYKVSLAR